MRQVIGYFEVTTPTGADRRVVVSQIVTANKEGVIVSARKIFTLDTPYGEDVNRTRNPKVFIRNGGEILKVRGHLHMKQNDCSVYKSGRW